MSVHPFRLTQTNATSVAIPNPRHRRPAVAIAAAFVFCLLSLALGARAEAYIYWTNPATNSIGRANLDGTDVDQSFISGAIDPRGIAVDAGHIYWVNWGDGSYVTNSIGRANVDGTGVEQKFIPWSPGHFSLGAVAVDAHNIYWGDFGTIGRASLDGGQQLWGFITDAGVPPGVAVDAGHVYLSYGSNYGNSIGRAAISGGQADWTFIIGATDPHGVAVDANHIYWANSGADSIGRANLDGTGVDQSFITGAHGAIGIAVDANHIYWTNSGTDSIGRANLDGTGVDQSFFITGADNPQGVAVNALADPPATPPDTNPPETTITRGAANKTDKTKVKFKFSSSEPDSTFECGLASRKFKPCTSPKTIKNLDQGKHKFKVRAIDAAGNVDPSAAKDKFKVLGSSA